MSRRGNGPPSRNLRLCLRPQEVPMSNFLTSSGAFRDGDIVVNREGMRVISEDPLPAATQTQDAAFNLDDLETVEVLGQGNSGIVHLARHKWTDQFYAVKVIQMNVDESIRKNIARELKIHRDLNCPSVVVCFHTFYDNGAISLVLEYMDRGSLADILKKCRTIPERQLSIICRQVLKGLVYLHQERRVIHRDLKPSNLLLNRMGDVKITDFGVSAVLTSSMGHRETFVGTYKYMSPERVSGDTHSYDSDIWSLGLVILECALGRFPYSPPEERWANFYELLVAIVGQPAPSASRDRFSVDFCSFISSCLQKEPTYRQSAVELLKHPFIRRYENLENEVLAEFIRQWIPGN